MAYTKMELPDSDRSDESHVWRHRSSLQIALISLLLLTLIFNGLTTLKLCSLQRNVDILEDLLLRTVNKQTSSEYNVITTPSLPASSVDLNRNDVNSVDRDSVAFNTALVSSSEHGGNDTARDVMRRRRRDVGDDVRTEVTAAPSRKF